MTAVDLPEIHITPNNPEQGKVVLKPVTEQELAESDLWRSKDSAVSLLPDEDQKVLATPRDAIESSVGPDGYLWGIHVLGRSALKLVGVAGLWKPDSHYPGAAIFILDPSEHSKGIGTSVHVGLTSYAFDHLGKPVVRARTLDVNEPSKRSLQKAGYVQTPTSHPDAVPYGTKEGDVSTTTEWMAFNPNGPQHPDQAFGGLGTANIEISRQNVERAKDAYLVGVHQPITK